jgi:Reverse transcriptase (RNA-dependent DNA polymerase)/Endonuclease-reverse transcriptase
MLPQYCDTMPSTPSPLLADGRLLFMSTGNPVFSARSRYSPRSRITALLLLLGGIEMNPGPPTVIVNNYGGPRGLRLGTLNVRSAVNKPTLIRDIIRSSRLDALVLTETWFNSDMPDTVTNDAAPLGYSVMHEFRSSGRGGGISVIYRSHLVVRRLKISSLHSSYERLALRVNIGNARMNIISIYRPPPTATALFFDEIKDMIEEVSVLPGNLIVIGDLNCPGKTSLEIDDRLTAVIDDHSMVQRVLSATHIASSSTTVDNKLDLIIHHESPSPVRSVSVVDVGISDHRLVIAILMIPMSRPETVSFTVRNVKSLDRIIFLQRLKSASFVCSPASNADVFYSQMKDDVTFILDDMAPLKRTTKRQSCSIVRNDLSSAAVILKRTRRSLERRYNNDRSEYNRLSYRAACRAANRCINDSRMEYNISRIESAKGNHRDLWKISKELLCTNVKKGFDPACKLTADILNQFFIDKLIDIRKQIASALSKLAVNYALLTQRREDWSPVFSDFATVNPSSVYNVIIKLNRKTAQSDFIPTYLLKEFAMFFSEPFAHLANLSFGQAIFPSSLKLGCITPILKKPGLDDEDPKNYRPITILGTASKILEKLALEQLKPHITGSANFSSRQSAYRSAHSTETALLKITSDIRCNMERSAPSCLLSLDISAAFDVLDHQTLLKRAEDVFGLSGPVLAWLSSFLSDRQCFVSIGTDRPVSNKCLLATGVPQGSTLGPILFAMFVSPLGDVVAQNNAEYHQYADDTQLYMRLSPSLDNLCNLSTCAEQVAQWFLLNGLMLNANKTEAIIFGTSQRLSSIAVSKPMLHFSGVGIDFADSVKILGVTLDKSLTMSKQVTKTVASCNNHIRALRHIRSSISTATATMLACSLINTRLDYCNSLLTGTSSHNIARLQRVQNNLARVVLKLGRRESISQHIYDLHWLRIPERIEYKIAVLTCKVLATEQPSYLSESISRHVAARTLRSGSRNTLNTPRCLLKAALPAFCYSAPSVWNGLSEYVKSSESIDIFKSRLKTELFHRYR